jgi:hypothetical protein
MRPWEIHAGLYGLAANVAALGLITLLRPNEPDSEESEYLRVASTPAD